MTDLNHRVNVLLIACLGCEAHEIQPEKELVADLLADSMALMDIALALESQFGIEMDEEKMERMIKVEDLYRMVATLH